MKKEIMISALLALTIGITAACGSEKESRTHMTDWAVNAMPLSQMICIPKVIRDILMLK